MSVADDLSLIAGLPVALIMGESLDDIDSIQHFKGKFVVTEDAQFFAKIIPIQLWDAHPFFHDELVRSLGVQNPESMDVKDMIIGGGKMEVELVGDHLECRLGGKSTIYGDHNPDALPQKEIQESLVDAFDLENRPVTIELDADL